MSFIATAWNNSHRHQSGAGYGLKISFEDRERFFNREWRSVYLQLNGFEQTIEVNVGKASFWNRNCGELIKKDIGRWFIQNGHANWPQGRPPRVIINLVGERLFRIELE